MTNFRNDQGTGSVEANVGTFDTATVNGDSITRQKVVPINVVEGAASGTYFMPANSFVDHYYIETTLNIPGTPTNTNLRLGSTANGQQYVADVDVKAFGVINATMTTGGRRPRETFYTVASSGGTAALQNGLVNLIVVYALLA
jgi:hypothetical protein